MVRRVSTVRAREEGALRSRQSLLGDTPSLRFGSGRCCGPPGASVHWPNERTLLSSVVASLVAVRSVADRCRKRRAMTRVVARCRLEACKVERCRRCCPPAFSCDLTILCACTIHTLSGVNPRGVRVVLTTLVFRLRGTLLASVPL